MGVATTQTESHHHDSHKDKIMRLPAVTPSRSSGNHVQPAVEMESNDADEDTNGKQLPFSKFRCIALVLTVTGAAFLNVSIQLCCSQEGRIHITTKQS